MTSESEGGLLTSRDARPVHVTNREGASRFLLLGDHAGARIPERLGDLGLASYDRGRHIALDLGVEALGMKLAQVLDAPFVAQRYSRLVIDCNRALTDPSSMAEISDGTRISGNEHMSAESRRQRAEAIYDPYHRAIAEIIAEREAEGISTTIVSLHSFTPQLAAAISPSERPWQVGVLYGGGNERFARAMLQQLQLRGDLVVGDNEPYAFDGTDFTVPEHAFDGGRPYVEIEVRQDQIATLDGVMRWTAILADALCHSSEACAPD